MDRHPEEDGAGSDSDHGDNWSDYQLESDEEELEELAELEAAAGGIQPYQFEPQFAEDEDIVDHGEGARGGEEDVENRLGNNDWCSCGGCEAMEKVRESICCKEVEKVVSMMDECDEEDNLDCITYHPGFQGVCLDRYVLDTAYHQYRQQYGNTARVDATVDERYRHVAYRQFARWIWGFLGRHVRIPLPSCAVAKIRQTFPPPALDAYIYTGFEDA